MLLSVPCVLPNTLNNQVSQKHRAFKDDVGKRTSLILRNTELCETREQSFECLLVQQAIDNIPRKSFCFRAAGNRKHLEQTPRHFPNLLFVYDFLRFTQSIHLIDARILFRHFIHNFRVLGVAFIQLVELEASIATDEVDVVGNVCLTSMFVLCVFQGIDCLNDHAFHSGTTALFSRVIKFLHCQDCSITADHFIVGGSVFIRFAVVVVTDKQSSFVMIQLLLIRHHADVVQVHRIAILCLQSKRNGTSHVCSHLPDFCTGNIRRKHLGFCLSEPYKTLVNFH